MSSKKYNLSHSMKTLFISLVGMALGAKLFGYLTGIYRAIGLGDPITPDTLRDTGIVYYGGLLGLIAVYSVCIKYKRSTLDVNALDVLAVCVPLFHAIARVGCFLSGCCYGKVHAGLLAINYTTIIEGNIDENLRFPVQLLEALFEISIFIYLLSLLQREDWKNKRILGRYLTVYCIGRFFLEMLRGDVRRGIVYGFSFSQCISVLIWIVLVCILLRRKRIKIIEGGF